MEVYKGTGAECMIQMQKNNYKGKVDALDGTNIAYESKHGGKPWITSALSSHIFLPCEYHPPEPVWREVDQPTAYKAAYEGKVVEAKRNGEPDTWGAVEIWNGMFDNKGYYDFRIQEETP